MFQRLKASTKTYQFFKSCRYCSMEKHEQRFKNIINDLPETQYSALDNGLIVATEERPILSACFGLYIEAGSRFEDKHDNGAANFFEFLAFNSCDVMLLGERGARVRAITTRELVIYFVECLATQVPEALKLLLNAVFGCYSMHQMDTVRPLVYHGLERHEENVTNHLDDYLHATAFQGTALGYRVMGTHANICSMNDSAITRHIERFVPNKMVLAAVGGVKHDMMANYANCLLGQLRPNCEDAEDSMCGGGYRYTGSELRHRNDLLKRGHVAIAVEGPSFCEADRLPMEVAACVLGGWDRLQSGGKDSAHFMSAGSCAEDLSDAHCSFYIPYKHTGLWGVQFSSKSVNLDDFQLMLTDQWMKLAVTVTEGEVARARNEMITKYLSQIESIEGACHDIGRWTLYTGCRPSPKQKLQLIDKVNVEAVRTACFKYIYDKCPAVAAYGATEGLGDYTRIRASMYWLRY